MAISFECGYMLYCTCGAVVVIFQFSSIINYSLFIINSKKPMLCVVFYIKSSLSTIDLFRFSS